MTPRERYIAALTFQTTDKVPLVPGWPRESTLARWRREGLGEKDYFMDRVLSELGIAPESTAPHVGLEIDFRMVPWFEEKVLEHRDGHYIVQDWMGNVVEIADTYDLTYLRRARDFVTRKWHRFPVNNRDEWELMKKRYNAGDPKRFPDDFASLAVAFNKRDYPAGLSVNGPFWQLREWLGFEPLCELFLTDPDFVQDMITFWEHHVAAILEKTFARATFDWVQISEDMAFKAHPMISPDMARRFLLPVYERWVALIRSYGCPIVNMDSDGYIEDLIPLWIDAGINVCNPIEVAAHNDIVAFRKKFGRRMAYAGGIDKRLIAEGGAAIEGEVDRVCALLDMGGGLIPSCDHGVPPDISWPDFIRYTGLLAKKCGWK